MIYCSLDFETRSEFNLKAGGMHAYAEHPSTEVMCLAYAIGAGPVKLWTAGDAPPVELLEHIRAGGAVRAWNAAFELTIWEHVIGRDYPEWPRLTPEQTYCTMAQALALALPGSLDACAVAMKSRIKKDKEGGALMRRMCKPLPQWVKHSTGEKWLDSPELRQRLGAYCVIDVGTERALADKLAPLSASERELWLLDYRINRRGVPIDLRTVNNAQRIVDAEAARLNGELAEITGGAVEKATNAGALQKWLAAKGLELPDMRKGTVAEYVGALEAAQEEHAGKSWWPELAPAVADAKHALELRAGGGLASVRKLGKIQKSCSSDGRARGQFRYHVATTGRWAGGGIQLHNLKRPALKQKQIEDAIGLMQDAGTGAEMLRYTYGEPTAVISSCMRGLVCTDAAHDFICADYSNIEGRVIAWLAGEQWKLQAFRDYDAGTGPDLYKLAYSRSFGVPVESIGSESDERQTGKAQELGLGFGGGVGAFLTMAGTYRVDLNKLAQIIIAMLGPVRWKAYCEEEKARPFAMARRAQFRDELTDDAYWAIKYAVQRWRGEHTEIASFWWDLEECAFSATKQPGTLWVTKTGLIKFKSTGHFLFCQLPGGRLLSYPQPSIADKRDDITGETKPTLRYWTQVKNSWVPTWTYGGHLAENVTQATARDILANALKRLEAAGYAVALHVHDQAAAEVATSFGSVEEFGRIMCDVGPVYAGLPVSAPEPWRGKRFRK